MPIEVRCPNPECGKTYSIASETVSGKAQCKQCGTVFEMASSIDPSADAPSAPKSSGSRDSSIPDRLGRFLIRSKLGAGAFGTVYRAFDPSLDREVALKVPQAGLLDSPKAVERFLREARAAARLRHPHIVPLYETGLDDGRHYIASAYIEGTTLADIIEPGGIDPTRAAKIVLQLAEALHYAHSEKIVHRDVKPANVMLDAKGDAHLMDFGLARFELSEEKLTQDGAILGTPAYMAPEQAIGRSGEANAASDQYSLGVTLYEFLCGQTPFSGPSDVVLFQVTEKEPERLRSVRPTIPRDLETICHKAMAKATGDRYANCGDLGDDLRRWLMDEPIRARRQGLPEQARRWARRNPAVAGLTLAVGVLLTTVALVATILKQEAQAQRSKAEETNKRLVQEQDQTKAALRDADIQRREAQAQRSKAEEKGRDADAQRLVAEEGNKRLLKEQYQTKLALKESQRLLCKSALDRGLYFCEQGEVDRGLISLARGLEIAIQCELPQYERVIRHDLAGWGQDMAQPARILDTGLTCTSLAFSPDGKLILTGSNDKEARLWDARTCQPTRKPFHHPNKILSVAFSPDGKKIVTGCVDHSARVWDIEEGGPGGKPLVLEHYEVVNSASFSRDGSFIVTGSDDQKARIWDSGSGKMICRPIEHPSEARPIIADGKPVRHPRAIKSVAISPDGLVVLTGSEDKTARFWDAKTGASVGRSLHHAKAVNSVAFSPDGRAALTGSDDKSAQLWDVETGEPIGRPLAHPVPVASVAFSQDGSSVLIGGGRFAQLWDARTFERVGRRIEYQGDIYSVAFNPDGITISIGGTDRTARLWKVPKGDVFRWLVKYEGTALSVAYSPDGNTFLTTGSSWEPLSSHGYYVCLDARIWDAKSGEPLGPSLQHTLEEVERKRIHRSFRSVAFSPDGRTALTGSEDNTARLWDVKDGRPIGTPMKHDGHVNSVAFSPDGKIVVTGAEDKVVKLWNPSTGVEIGPRITLQGPVNAVTFSRDGAMILTGSDDRTARLWDVKDGRPIGQPMEHDGTVNAVAFSPNRRVVLTGSGDHTARLWDAKTGDPVGRTFRHPGSVNAVAFSPDGKGVLIGGEEGTLQLWDVETGEPLGLPIRIPTPVRSAAFSPDGANILIGGSTIVLDVMDTSKKPFQYSQRFKSNVGICKCPPMVSESLASVLLNMRIPTRLRMDKDGDILEIPASELGDLQGRRKELGDPAPP